MSISKYVSEVWRIKSFHESDTNRMLYFREMCMFSGASVRSGQVTIKSPSVCLSAAHTVSSLRHPAEIFFRKQAKFLFAEKQSV